MNRHIYILPVKLLQRQQIWHLPLSKKVQLLVSECGLIDGCRRSYSSTSATRRKKKKSTSRQREAGKKKLIEKERIIKNPFKYENKRDGIELVRKGKIFSPEEVKDGYHLAVLLVTLQKFGFADDKALLFRYAERAHALSPMLYPKPAALILNVLAKNQLVHIPLLSSLSSRLVPRLLRHANAQDLALLLHAFAAFKWADSRFFAAAAEEIPHKLPFFEPQHLVAVAQAINKLHSYSSSSNSSLAGDNPVIDSCRREGRGWGGIAVIEQHALLLDDIAEETLRKLPRFDARATALIAAALGSAAAAARKRSNLLPVSERSKTCLLTNRTTCLSLSAGGDSNISLLPSKSACAATSSVSQTAVETHPRAASALAAPVPTVACVADSSVSKASAGAESGCEVQSVATAPNTTSASEGADHCAPANDASKSASAAARSSISFFLSPAGGGGSVGRCTRPLFWNRLLDHAFTLREEMDAAELIKVFSGAANAKAEQHEAFALYASGRILQVFDELPLALLSQLFNACAKWGYYDKRLLAAVTRRVTAAVEMKATRWPARMTTTAKYETPDVACIGQLLHACGCLRHKDPLLVEFLAYRLYHHALEATAAAAQAASNAVATACSAKSAVDSPAAGASLAAIAADRFASWQVANNQQQQDYRDAYADMALHEGQKPQHKLTPQTLAVSLRALYRLKWGQFELPKCNSNTSAISRTNIVAKSGSNRTDDIEEGVRDNKVWKKELVPLLAHLVLQQLHFFTPQGLCECTDALSGLLFRSDDGTEEQHAQRQQQRSTQRHESDQKTYLPQSEQKLEMESGGKEAYVTDRFQCDENILFYRLAQQLTSMWPLLSLQGAITIIRAFGRRGKNGDVPLFHRCIDKVRHALRSMSFEECLLAKQAVAASLSHALKRTISLSPLPRHAQRQGVGDTQEQIERRAESEREGGYELPSDDHQQRQSQQFQRQPPPQPQRDHQPDAEQQNKNQQQKCEAENKIVQLQRGEQNIQREIPEIDGRALSINATLSPIALSNHLNDLTTPDAASGRTGKSVKRRTREADTLHRIASFAAALDRRLHSLRTSAAITQALSSDTDALTSGTDASATRNFNNIRTAASSVAAATGERAAIAAHRPAASQLLNKGASDAAAAAAAAAKEEELAQLLFDNHASFTCSGIVDFGPDKDDASTLPNMQELDKETQKGSTENQSTEGWMKQTTRADDFQQLQQPEEKTEWLQRSRGEQQYRQRQHPLQQRREDTSFTHTSKTVVPPVSLPCRSAAPEVFGDSLDALIALRRSAASDYAHSSGSSSSSSKKGTCMNRINSVRYANDSDERSFSTEISRCSVSSNTSDTDSSRSQTRGSNCTTEGITGRKKGCDKHGRGFLEAPQPISPADTLQQDAHWQQVPKGDTGQLRTQRPLPHKHKIESTVEESNADEEDEEEEESQLSLRELLRPSFSTVQQTEIDTDKLCKSMSFSGIKQQRTTAALKVSEEQELVGAVEEEEKPLRSQHCHYPKGDQQVHLRSWHQEAYGQPHELQDEAVNTQQLCKPVNGETLELVHVTRGRRRRQCARLRQEEPKQQNSSYTREQVVAAGEESNAVLRPKNLSLSLSGSAALTPPGCRLAGKGGGEWNQTGGAAPKAAATRYGAERPCATEVENINQGRSGEEARMTSLVTADACTPRDDMSCVDGTGLIVRNKQLRERAAAAGGYETGYVDLTNLLGSANSATVCRPENRHPGSLSGGSRQSWACRANSTNHADSGSSLSSNTTFSSSNSYSNWRRGRGGYAMQEFIGGSTSTEVPLFSATTGGRKIRRLHKK